jgi:general secretion pathway protein M
MISRQRLGALLSRFPLAAVTVYFALVVVFAFITMDGALQVVQRRDAVAAASEVLNRIEARDPARAPAVLPDVGVPTGSPFLEGATASVAGAALLQRVTAATKRMKGNTLSSQVDLQGPLSKTGFITVTSSFEIDPAQLQPLLYDLEAGMPVLFVDELVVQAPSGSAEGGKLRVLLSVAGQRQGPK